MVELHFALVFLIPLLAAVSIAWALRSRLRKQARAVVAQAGEVAIHGRIGLAGDGVEVERRPKRRAVASRWTRRSRQYGKLEHASSKRAEQLWLATEHGEIELRGRIEVWIGSRSSWRSLGRGYEMLRSLDAGDGVQAYGKLVEAAEAPEEDPADYRTTASRRQLEPLVEGGAIRLVYLGASSLFDRRLLFHPLVIVPFLLLLRLPYTAFANYSAAKNDARGLCREDGECHVVPRWRFEGFWTLFEAEITGKHFTEAALDDRDCNQSWGCELDGECSASGGECKVGSDRDCRSSGICADLGQCSDIGGHCEPQNADCAARTQCAVSGECSARDNKCVAASDADCRKSDHCRDGGYCKAADGSCVHSGTYCKSSDDCIEDGQCSLGQYRCVATSQDDCHWSQGCRFNGRCQLAKGFCVDPGDACKSSVQCRVHGMCAGKKGACHADSERDCQASLGCKQRGACRLIDKACRKSCADDPDCRLYGLCTNVKGRCVARGHDCRKSQACTESGHCTARDGKCVAGSSADCRASLGCREFGMCTLKNGSCLLVSDTDCRLTEGCRNRGDCSFSHGDCLLSDADCRKLEGCKEFGRCSAGKYGFDCRTTSDADCKQSAVCKGRGWCKLISGEGERACFAPPELASGA